MRLEGKIALITGGGTGIGAATARRFAAEGSKVVVLGPEPEPLEQVASETGGIAVPGGAVRTAVERFGGLDVLVTCAGYSDRKELLALDDEAWHRLIRANLDTAVVSARESLPALLERGGGSIVVVASVAALTASSSNTPYITAKTGLLGLVRSLAVDYGPQGVRVNAVCPGLTRTPMTEPLMQQLAKRRGTTVDEAFAHLDSVAPLRRHADPSEIASVCLFLASDESSFVTGSALVVDGGQTAVNVGMLPLILG
jgi:NAD(P)-dependent dehydrogenase (short-subunit alcohol dehydrogenase family)